MIDKIFKFLENSYKYYGPFLILPLIVIYFVDLVIALGRITQLLAGSFVVVSFMCFLLGLVLGVFTSYGEATVWHALMGTRLAEFQPIKWGTALAKWLIEPQSSESK